MPLESFCIYILRLRGEIENFEPQDVAIVKQSPSFRFVGPVVVFRG